MAAEAQSLPRRHGLLVSLRRTPRLAAEVLTLHALSAVAPALRSRPADLGPTAQVVHGVISRASRRAARDGLITGTSFVVAYPAALGALYLTQTLMLLEIAAAHGFDPTDPARAPELLVIRGRHASPEQAVAALEAASGTIASAGTVPQARPPLSAGRRLLLDAAGRVRRVSLPDAVLGILNAASFVVPLIGMPICSFGAARATRRLGLRAEAYYGERRRTLPMVAFDLPEPPSMGAALLAAVVIVGMILLGLMLSTIWVGDGHQGLWRIGLAIVWALVLAAYTRLGLLLLAAVRSAR